MDRRNRPGLTFSLSFLDVMSVGLGSVILIFLIINHASQERSREASTERREAVEQMQAEFDAREATAEALARAVEASEEALMGARAQLREQQRLIASRDEEGPNESKNEDIQALQEEIRQMEARVADLRRESLEAVKPDSVFARAGSGRRQYLTGLDVSGEHILILVDVSASMLAETIVETIRLRNMSAQVQQAAVKWQWALDSASWMVSQIPPEARFQIYTFNDQARSVIPDQTGNWLEIGDGTLLGQALARLREVLPSGGTSLHQAFSAAAGLRPAPDSIILITDHTPTVGASAGRRGRIGADQRRRLFVEAFAQLPAGVPVNVVLLPMEGDPMAASLFWQLAQTTGGVMLSPARDWP
ncbi:MAG: VWA domain-containing protein [Wenzhouxiangellaceae bacterium]|nr:VWA domain-containing protein [Wenzhouxiangellaceae bacterium]